jgi:hypothetical protein
MFRRETKKAETIVVLPPYRHSVRVFEYNFGSRTTMGSATNNNRSIRKRLFSNLSWNKYNNLFPKVNIGRKSPAWAALHEWMNCGKLFSVFIIPKPFQFRVD